MSADTRQQVSGGEAWPSLLNDQDDKAGQAGSAPAEAAPDKPSDRYDYSSPARFREPRGAAGISDAAAARFLQQAQFSSSPAAIARVQALGFAGWLEEAFARPRGQTGVSWLDENGYGAITERGEYFWPQFGDYMAWNQMLTGEDELRRRTAFALSEFMVVSLDPIDGFWPPYMIAAYWDLLCDNAFGNFRVLLEKISMNAAMGLYLNTKGNLKGDPETGRRPDENYAREIMQLFTIGLYELNLDGTLKLDENGAPIETYTQDDITGLAHAFTGYDYNYDNNEPTDVAWLDYDVPSTSFCTDRMKLKPENHSVEDVTFLGLTIPGYIHPSRKLDAVHDHLFNHPNVGPYFGRQMIQRLVTSDPSPAYVARVAAAFNDNGKGERGDLKGVWRAVLTDPEARAEPALDSGAGGKLREPVIRFAQWARTVGISADEGRPLQLYNTSRSDQSLGQSPLRSPSVFNYFRPGYVPPQTQMAKEGMTVPEFQVHNESSTAGYINFLQWAIAWGMDTMRPTYDNVMPLVHDGPALLDWLDLHMTAGQLSGQTRELIGGVVAAQEVDETSGHEAKIGRLVSACLMVMASPDYLIQK